MAGTSQTPPWQQRTPSSKNPFKKRFPTNLMNEVTEDDDAYVLDEEDEDEFDPDWEDEYDQDEEDPDQVAYVDEEGWFHADEETINTVGNFLS